MTSPKVIRRPEIREQLRGAAQFPARVGIRADRAGHVVALGEFPRHDVVPGSHASGIEYFDRVHQWQDLQQVRLRARLPLRCSSNGCETLMKAP